MASASGVVYESIVRPHDVVNTNCSSFLLSCDAKETDHVHRKLVGARGAACLYFRSSGKKSDLNGSSFEASVSVSAAVSS